MGGRAQFFQLLAGEDVQGNKMDLGVTVLSGFGGGHVHNLAWAILDHDMSVLTESGTLHWVGGRGAGIDALESVIMLEMVGELEKL